LSYFSFFGALVGSLQVPWQDACMGASQNLEKSLRDKLAACS